MNAPVTIPPEAEKEAAGAEQFLTDARSFAVTSREGYDLAANELKRIKAKAGQLEDLRLSITRPLDESKKRVMDFFRGPLQLLADAESAYKRAMLGFQQEQERARKAAEAAAAEAARKERERMEREAAKLERKGKVEQAEATREIAAAIPERPVISAPPPRAEGISTRKTWSARVVDERKLVEAIAAGKVPMLAHVSNLTFLNQQARSLKGELQYPGVEVVCTEQIAARA